MHLASLGLQFNPTALGVLGAALLVLIPAGGGAGAGGGGMPQSHGLTLDTGLGWHALAHKHLASVGLQPAVADLAAWA